MLHTLALTVPVLALAAVAVPAPGCPATVARATALRPILPEAFGAALTAAADECRLDLAGDITLFAPSNTDESVGHYVSILWPCLGLWLAVWRLATQFEPSPPRMNTMELGLS
jgi:hypothetical protein